MSMDVQGKLFQPGPAIPLSVPSLEELSVFQTWRRDLGGAASTVASEVSQLRSLARLSEELTSVSLRELRGDPEAAAMLIEKASKGLGMATVLTRIRAFQRFLMMGVSPYLGRQRVRMFQAALPKKAVKGWYDAGVSVPGSRSRRRMPGPTPTADALEHILNAGITRTPISGAIAALACFSGLDVKEMCELKWRDLTWHDDGLTPYWEAKVMRRGHRVTVFVVGPGAQSLLKHGLASGLDRDAFLLRGRASDAGLSERALRDSLRASCVLAGWPKATRPQLVATLAAWLRSMDFDDHSIRLVLGRRRAASIDRMLHQHDQLHAQEALDAARDA